MIVPATAQIAFPPSRYVICPEYITIRPSFKLPFTWHQNRIKAARNTANHMFPPRFVPDQAHKKSPQTQQNQRFADSLCDRFCAKTASRPHQKAFWLMT